MLNRKKAKTLLRFPVIIENTDIKEKEEVEVSNNNKAINISVV